LISASVRLLAGLSQHSADENIFLFFFSTVIETLSRHRLQRHFLRPAPAQCAHVLHGAVGVAGGGVVVLPSTSREWLSSWITVNEVILNFILMIK
jgi:hypothetical protein